jgi:hypothetical protein
MPHERYETEQDKFWAGEFGDAYIERNRGSELLAAKLALLAKILSSAGAVSSLIELGANVGLNLVAPHKAPAHCRTGGGRNQSPSRGELRRFEWLKTCENSVLAFQPQPLPMLADV